jgi:sulfur-oxidizing protein SoxX
MKNLLLGMLAVVATAIGGCDTGVKSPRGFSLPEGNSDNGKAVFIKYQCLSCHQLEGVEQADIMKNPELSIKLGGKSVVVKTYAELVTSIINPSHKIARGYPKSLVQVDKMSKMAVYNDIMTVTELVDVVVFLQSQYELIPHTRTEYRFYEY